MFGRMGSMLALLLALAGCSVTVPMTGDTQTSKTPTPAVIKYGTDAILCVEQKVLIVAVNHTTGEEERVDSIDAGVWTVTDSDRDGKRAGEIGVYDLKPEDGSQSRRFRLPAKAVHAAARSIGERCDTVPGTRRITPDGLPA